MATSSEKATDERKSLEYTCTLCTEELKKPKLLSCQHSFCTQCLVQYHLDVDEGKPFCCPTCQMTIELADDTVESLPDNYLHYIFKEEDGSLFKHNLKCIPCSQGHEVSEATHKCLDCGDTLCQHCSEYHCKLTITRHHLVVAINDLQEGKYKDDMLSRKVLLCSLHSAEDHKIPLSSYCDDCRCLVCVTCMQVKHKRHSFTPIHTAREGQQRSFKDNFSNLQASQNDQDKRIGNIEKIITDTKQKWNTQEADIYDIATELYTMVDTIKDEKLTELKSIYEQELEYLNDLLNKERSKQSSLDATITFTEMFLEKSCDSDFLYHEDDVTKRMEESQKGPSQNSNRNVVVFEKQKANSMTQGILDVFGQIQTKKHFLHKGRIGEVNEIFRREIKSDCVYGLSYSKNQTEIFLVGEGDSNINIWSGDGHFRKTVQLDHTPADIHVNDSKIFVVNYQQSLRNVVVMDQDGIVEKSVLLPDDDQGSNGKLALAVGEDNCIFIASAQMHRIYKWHPEEDMSIIISKEMGHTLSCPSYICMTSTGELVVSNHGSSNIQIYSKGGELQWQHDYDLTGCYCSAKISGVCCDEDGYIFIVDKDNRRIQVLHDKKLVGNIRLNQGLKKPVPLISTPDGDLIYGHATNLVRISFWE